MARHLAAIMFTDLVGFTKLGQRNEEAALELRREHQSLLRPIFVAHGGREVKSLGDGFLVEFPSAVESVRCAVEVQRTLAERNARPEAVERIDLRIGLHVGDIIDDGTDVVGDAVNVASRIEPLAEPGGICVSAAIYDQVRNKVPLTFEKLGPVTLKNVEEPLELYRVRAGAKPSVPRPELGDGTTHPRLAVLPLANLSADPADEFFADGLTDELISRTSQIPLLRVIARTSVQRYRGSPKSIREVGQELNVGAALEGSVRKAGTRVRISVQLVDTRSEAHLWSMRYDRPLNDIFAIQDEIAGQVANSIAAHFSDARSGAGVALPSVVPDTTDLDAYSLYLHGRQLFGARGSEESIRIALSMFEGAVSRDPKFARARVGVAEASLWLAGDGAIPFDAAERRATEELRQALELNEGIAEAHSALAGLMIGLDRVSECEREARRAIELNPSLSDPYRWLAQLAAGFDRLDESVRLLELARQLNPEDVNVLAFLGRALWYAGRERDALALWEETKPRVRYRVNANLTEYYLTKGDLTRAEETVRELERLRPESVWTVMYRGFLAARQGDRIVADRAIERLARRARSGEMTIFFQGFVHFALGENDEFVEALEEALRHHSLPALEVGHSPLFAGARTDARVQDILRRQRLVAADLSPAGPREPPPTTPGTPSSPDEPPA